jgi:tRNA/tmRNA/rRNA uracil-C5-methylase (TrmA/RlmC/RlmD family)
LAARWVDSLASQPRTALDLFCGAGLAGLLATARTTALHGIDNHDEVIAAARRSAAAAGRSEARYDARDARAALRELAQQGAHYDFALINPPRAGLGADLAPVVAALGVRAVVMISCHPAALARDLSALDAAGLKLTRLAAVDMFPQTAELEALALAVRDAD